MFGYERSISIDREIRDLKREDENLQSRVHMLEIKLALLLDELKYTTRYSCAKWALEKNGVSEKGV